MTPIIRESKKGITIYRFATTKEIRSMLGLTRGICASINRHSIPVAQRRPPQRKRHGKYNSARAW